MPLSLTAVLALFGIGLYCALAKSNLIKKIIGINIMEAGLFLYLVAWGRIPGGQPPIVTSPDQHMVDPLPQALALTAIVIGASTTALMLGMTAKIYKTHKTLDITKLRRLKG